MCNRPDFEAIQKTLDEKLRELWIAWREYYLMFVDEDYIGTQEEQMTYFVDDVKDSILNVCKQIAD